MFAKVFNSARRILSRSPSAQDLREEKREDTPRSHDADTAMVTSTRRGPVTPSSSVQKPKGKRSLEVQGTPTVSKRRRKIVDAEINNSTQDNQTVEGADKPHTRNSSGSPDALDSRPTTDSQQHDEDVNVRNVSIDSDTIYVHSTDVVQQTKEIIDTSPLDSSTTSEVRSTKRQAKYAEPGSELEEKLPIRRRGSPKVVIAKASRKPSPPLVDQETGEEPVQVGNTVSNQDITFNTPGTHRASSVFQTPMTSRPEKEGSQTPKAQPASSGRTLGSRNTRSGKKNATRDSKEQTLEDQLVDSTPTAKHSSKLNFPEEIPSSTWDGEDGGISTQESHPESPLGAVSGRQKAHFRFGSEEPADARVLDATTTSPVIVKEPLQDDSDSDEAPEEVTAATAISKTRAVEAEAAKAFKAQQEREKNLKKERAERMAQEQERKKKRLEKKASEFAKVEAKKQARRRDAGLNVDINDLPAFLPDSILEAAGDMRPPTPPLILPGKNAEEEREEKLKRHIKFLERGQKPIKDVRKGSVNVHVLEKQNVFLAPKVNRDTKHVREKWLKGRQIEKKDRRGSKKVGFRKMNRSTFGGGFVRDDD